MQRDKGQRDIVSIWLRGHPDCFVMPDCSAGSDGSQWTCIILPTVPGPPTSGDKLWREERDTCDFICIALTTLPNRRTTQMMLGTTLQKSDEGKLETRKPLGAVYFPISACTVSLLKSNWEAWLRIRGACCTARLTPDMPDRWTDEIRHIDTYQTRWDNAGVRAPSGPCGEVGGGKVNDWSSKSAAVNM